jgi:hypothetical protein
MVFHRADCRLSGRLSPWKGRSWAVALAGYLLCFKLPRKLAAVNITGALLIAIAMPF